MPRVVIAAPASGQGKTSVATGLLAAFRARGLTVSPHKVGPDYIDPSYHALAAGRPGRNLDPWLVGEERIPALFRHGASTPTEADVAIIEGVTGLFDGAAGRAGYASTAHVATLLGAPVILVVDASAAGRSVAALVHGFATFDPQLRLGGVVLNRVGSDRHRDIVVEAVESVGVPVLGVVRRFDRELITPSRHLGLIPAAERSAEALATVTALGELIARSVDLDAVLRLARSAAPLPVVEPAAVTRQLGPTTMVAIFGGPAFTFGYAETSELLAAAGAEVAVVDPLRDETLPAGTAALVIGGGFPEVHVDALSANRAIRAAVIELAGRGAPIAAECAGLLYLARSLDGQPMCGVLNTEARMTERLTLGYREAVALSDSPLARAGTRVRGHEFHRTVCAPGAGANPAWQWQVGQPEGFVDRGVHASYLHLHWAGQPDFAPRFVEAAASAARAS
jgi:cobyrinic acid a,c-diamide synthase